MLRLRAMQGGGGLLATAGLVGCVAVEGFIDRVEKAPSDAGPASNPFFLDGATAAPSPLPEAAPHVVRAVDPTRGPFQGGQRAIVRGRGFTSDTRVWFGDTEATDIEVIDSRRIQLSVPEGRPGPAVVTVQNATDASTRRSLHDAYTYEAFFVTPGSGPTSGGTVVTVTAYGLDLGPATRVTIDLKPCEVLDHRDLGGSISELDCRAPAGTPGTKLVRIATDDETADVLNGFVYGDDSAGLRGGLSGAALDGRLRVRVFDAVTGDAVEGATVIQNTDLSPEATHSTNASGEATFDAVGTKTSITVAARCKMPITFVDIPVDTLTVHLSPVQSPECSPEGDPVLSGGTRRASASVAGELYWPEAREFRRGPWRNVPAPAREPAQRAAYVFPLESSPGRAFRLPSASERVTLDSDGTRGYAFEIGTGLGNLTLYALAGIEDRSVQPPRFTAYAFGLARGVSTTPSNTTEDVFIAMQYPLERGLTFSVEGPAPTPRGPDRVEGTAALRIGDLGYAIFPVSTQSVLLPATAPLSFVGLPALVGALDGSAYVLTATAHTGLSGTEPRSVLGTFATTLPDEALTLSGFVEIPILREPATNSLWLGTRLEARAAAGGPPADLTLLEVITGGERSTWTIVVPGEAHDVPLPDLSKLPDSGPRPGPTTIQITRARIDGFDYGSVRPMHLGRRGWQAYATDLYTVNYRPE